MKDRVVCLILEKSTTNLSIVIDNIKVNDDDDDDGEMILETLRTMWGMVDVAQMHTQDLLDGYEVRHLVRISHAAIPAFCFFLMVYYLYHMKGMNQWKKYLESINCSGSMVDFDPLKITSDLLVNVQGCARFTEIWTFFM